MKKMVLEDHGVGECKGTPGICQTRNLMAAILYFIINLTISIHFVDFIDSVVPGMESVCQKTQETTLYSRLHNIWSQRYETSKKIRNRVAAILDFVYCGH